MKSNSGKAKNIFAERGIGFYLTVPAIVFAILALVFYEQNGVTEFNPELNNSAIICLILGIVLSVLSLAADVIPYKVISALAKPIRYAAYLVELYAFLMFIYSQVTYIANVFVSIDGNSLTSKFILTTVFFLIAAGLTLVAACLNALKPWAKKETFQPNSEVRA